MSPIFSAIKVVLGEYWDYNIQNKPQNILQSTVGFEALMKLLSDILQDCPKCDTFSIQIFLPYIEKLKGINFSDVETYPIATKGKTVLYATMHTATFMK